MTPGEGDQIAAGIDPRQALVTLGYPETSEPERITGGWDTVMWKFTTQEGREHSLRIYCLPRRNEVARRERIALEACAQSGLPAPRIETVGEFENLPVAVLSWCPGRPLLSVVKRRPWSIWRSGRLLGDLATTVANFALHGGILRHGGAV